jgi:uncharacterized membrane protein (DUF441 family)
MMKKFNRNKILIQTSKEIINTGIGGSICAIAIHSGAFVFGIACGCLVAAGILHLEGKGKKFFKR